ncbi:MAG: hypothetical protein WDW38_004803 [Sanguina aurantia]
MLASVFASQQGTAIARRGPTKWGGGPEEEPQATPSPSGMQTRGHAREPRLTRSQAQAQALQQQEQEQQRQQQLQELQELQALLLYQTQQHQQQQPEQPPEQQQQQQQHEAQPESPSEPGATEDAVRWAFSNKTATGSDTPAAAAGASIVPSNAITASDATRECKSALAFLLATVDQWRSVDGSKDDSALP